MHKYYEYLEEYDDRFVLTDFLSDKQNGIKHQSWSPLIPSNAYTTAINDFMKNGRLLHFPSKYVYQWMGIIMTNTAILRANTNWAGHSKHFPYDVFVDEFFYENEEEGKEFYGDYVLCDNYLEELGFYEWMMMPDGSDAWSDFGIDPIEKLILEYDSNKTPEQVLVIINKILDVIHQRGDLASIFIEGGRKTLYSVSNGMNESKIKLKITESQYKSAILNEMAYPQSFNLDVFKSLNTFQKRIQYCNQNLKRIGSGSSRIVYQIDDQKVLKLAKNKKGISQNEVECDGLINSYDIAPIIYDYDSDMYLWIESELARPVKKQDFKRLVGYDFETICAALYHLESRGKYIRNYEQHISNELYEEMYDNEWMYNIFTYVSDFQPPIGDLTVLHNYGIVKRNGNDYIVIVDTGLNDDVWNKHYTK